MLFASVDFIKYLFGLGLYSKDSLLKDNAILASNNFVDQLDSIEGLLFHKRFSILSWFIMYITGSPYSHAAIYIGEEKIIHATPPKVLTWLYFKNSKVSFRCGNSAAMKNSLIY
jgi:hypothetical protein